jgi:formylglycine-generating enzyme required for sulfatase activity
MASEDSPLKLATMFEFVPVPECIFQEGDVFGECREDALPIHEVRLDSFYIGKYPVTQKQWQKVMGANPSHFVREKNHPVESVSWYDVQVFLAKLNERTGKTYRLPTEAEWECAARCGGKKERWAGTSDEGQLGKYAWYKSNAGGRTHAVGKKKANEYGIYDMSGNVLEWCNDWYNQDFYRHSILANPQGVVSGSMRSVRGGSWNFIARCAQSAFRAGASPDRAYPTIGFRLVLPCNQSLET